MRGKMSSKTINDFDRELGGRLRACRNALGMSQAEMAGHLDISFQQVQKYENGRNRVSAGRLQEIAELFDIEPGTFYRPVLPIMDKQSEMLVRAWKKLPPGLQSLIDALVKSLAEETAQFDNSL